MSEYENGSVRVKFSPTDLMSVLCYIYHCPMDFFSPLIGFLNGRHSLPQHLAAAYKALSSLLCIEELAHFHLKKILYGFPLAFPYCCISVHKH